jgi:hypothetical protein
MRKKVITCWLKGLLDQSAQGLVLNEDGETRRPRGNKGVGKVNREY